jgi:dTDP-4-dehydrorhamnose reductase
VTVVVLGAHGQLGRALLREFPTAAGVDREELDLTDAAAVRDHDWAGVDVVLNAAAYTAVDATEDPANLAAVRAVNVAAVEHLAAVAGEHGFTLVHFSTEYVFDGRHSGPMPEDLPPAPLSVYGRTKAEGDAVVAALARHYLVRTTWLIGEGRNFVRTMIGLADGGKQPTVVADQIGRPTFAVDLAAGVRYLVERGEPFGTYNLTNSGNPVSWADLAAAVFELRGRSRDDVRPVTTAEYVAATGAAAPRPLNSVLDLSKITGVGFAPRDWRPALAEYVNASG